MPGGGLSPGAARWIAGSQSFFLPVKPLAKLFRRLFLEQLQASFDAGELTFFNDLATLADPAAFTDQISAMRRINRVVYAKKPFGGPVQVLACLGRYTHRVAIANSRLVGLDDDHVAFSWKDYRHNGAVKIMRLAPDEFIRRFLLHTLPDGFHRIRHFGFMANSHRAAKLAMCRSLLADANGPPSSSEAQSSSNEPDDLARAKNPESPQPAKALPACPDCGGSMRIIRDCPRRPGQAPSATAPFWCDTS